MNLDESEKLAAEMRTAHLIKTLMERNQELEAMLEAIGAGGVSAQRVAQAKDHIAQPRKMVAAQEPFATSNELFCEMCGQKGVRRVDGEALPDFLYAVPQPQADCLRETAELKRLSACCPELNTNNYGHDDVDELNSWAIEVSQCIDRAICQPQADVRDTVEYLDYLIRNQARVRNNLDEYYGEEDDVDCGYWLEFTDSNSQTWVQIGVFKTPRDAIDAAIAAAKEMK